MAVTQYIGARYVPLFADPAEWNSTREYEPLTVVLYQGASYTSRQAVPIGIDISNDDFWVRTADYNAQVNQYRQEVLTFDGRITANATAISDEVSARSAADTALQGSIDAETSAREDAVTQLSTDISDEVSARTAADTALQGSIDAETSAREDAVTQLSTDISDEVSARTAADTALQDSFDASILQETNARIAADNALSLRIDEVSGLGTFGRLFEGQKSIGFGDSNMVGGEAGTNHVYRQICDKLGCLYDNRGVNGVTFSNTSGRGSIIDQISLSESDEDVKLVVVIGGINDLHYTDFNETTFANNVRATLNMAHNYYPNAVIVCIFDQGRQWPNARNLRYAFAMNRACGTMSYSCMSVPTIDVSLDSGMYASQNHWNESGCAIVANRAVSMLVGGSIAPMRAVRTTPTIESAFSDVHVNVMTYIDPVDCIRTDEYGIYFGSGFKYNNETTGTIPSGTRICDLPGGFSQMLGRTALNFVLVPTSFASSGGQTGNIQHTSFNFVQDESNNHSLTDSPILHFNTYYQTNVANINSHHTDMYFIRKMYPISY